MIFVAVFLIILFPIYARLFTSDERWNIFKEHVKGGVKGATVDKVTNYKRTKKSANRKRKIYRR